MKSLHPIKEHYLIIGSEGGGSMEELTYILTIVNIFKGIIDILKYFQEQKKNAKGGNPKRK